ncbi:Cytochrome c mono- and diheme variants [Vibrio sp. B1FLJ16]|nr:Cytochrome c mono- and diheme variants [Vibrio sp. B1FLJ16]CAE6936853.1 Cytochrome c mono- and diheme variants [Vibrio sp. B1FLJ16]
MLMRKTYTSLLLMAIIFTPVVFSEDMGGEYAKGKYLVQIGGCNDCHTAGYAPSGGTTPESQWLMGDQMGFRGPWGTTYPVNLREYVGNLSEAEWIAKAKVIKTRPPMPWWALNEMKEEDLSAVYQYIKSLGSAENAVPSFVPPEEEPKTPYIQWPQPPK